MEQRGIKQVSMQLKENHLSTFPRTNTAQCSINKHCIANVNLMPAGGRRMCFYSPGDTLAQSLDT